MITRLFDALRYHDVLGNSRAAPVVVSIPPQALLTDDLDGRPRMRVDVGQTGFFDGREFRTFRRLSLSSGATLVVKAVVPVNTILFGMSLDVVEGWADIETVTGGTEGGSFPETLPIFNRNSMTTAPSYAPQVVLTAGGTHTGGTVLDAISARSSGATAQAASVGVSTADERGIAPGTYYFRVANPGNGSVTGIWHARWEERP